MPAATRRVPEEEGRNMDPETVEALLILGKLALILGGGCAVVYGSLYAIGAAVVHYFERRDRQRRIDGAVR